MGDADQYAQGDRLVCPKCRGVLQQIGLDYERPTQSCRCSACKARFPAPRPMAGCAACGAVQDPADTRERLLHRYVFTPAAAEAVSTRRLAGLDLHAVIRDPGTGAYAPEYLAHEVRREAQRARLHGTPTAFVLLRCPSLSASRRHAPARAKDHAVALVAAVAGRLRPLDVTARVGEDELAILLPETDLAAAEALSCNLVEVAQAVPPVPGVEADAVDLAVVMVDPLDADLGHVLTAARAALSDASP